MTASTLPAIVRRLVTDSGARSIDEHTIDDFLDAPGDRVLFFCGDSVQFPEGLDVAVVLPELQRALPGRFAVGVVEREAEAAIARRYGMQRWPALVFLRDGQYVTTVAGMHDWLDYLQRVKDALAMPTTRPPTIGIPLVGAAVGSACH